LLKISENQGNLNSEEVWQSRDLRGNFSEPVYYNGHLYGYNSAFSTCVDGPSGKSLCKSRRPGDSSLILVDDKLLVLAGDGMLTIVKAPQVNQTPFVEHIYICCELFSYRYKSP